MILNNKSKTSLLFLFLPLLFALVLSPITNIRVTPDSVFYLEKALDLFNGHGYTYAKRGPGYPFLLSSGFYFFGGATPFAAMVVLRILFVANILICMLLTQRLFTDRVAICTGLLLVTADYFNSAYGTISIDGVYPFFVLSGVYACVVSLDKNSRLASIIAGICFGAAVLVKELALLHFFFPLAVLLLLSSCRNSPEKRKLLLMQQGVALLVILPWFLFVYFSNDDWTKLLGGGKRTMDRLSDVDSESGFSILGPLQFFWSGLETYFNRNIKSLYLWPLIVGGWIGLLVASLRSERPRIILILMLLFLPGIVAQGYIFMRTGQNFLFYTGGFIGVAYCLGFIVDKIASMEFIRLILILVFSVSAGAAQASYDKIPVYKQWKLQSVSYRKYKGLNSKWATRGIINRNSTKTAHWVKKRIKPGETIYTGYTFFRSLYFETGGQYKVKRLPYGGINFTPFTEPPVSTIKSRKHYENQGKMLFLWNHVRADKWCRWQKEPCLFVRSLFEDQLLRAAEENEVKYFILESRTWFFRHYFDQHPHAEKLAQLNPQTLVYRLDKYERNEDFVLHVADEIPILAEKIKKEDAEGYRYFKEEMIEGAFGVSLDEEYIPFPKNPGEPLRK